MEIMPVPYCSKHIFVKKAGRVAAAQRILFPKWLLAWLKQQEATRYYGNSSTPSIFVSRAIFEIAQSQQCKHFFPRNSWVPAFFCHFVAMQTRLTKCEFNDVCTCILRIIIIIWRRWGQSGWSLITSSSLVRKMVCNEGPVYTSFVSSVKTDRFSSYGPKLELRKGSLFAGANEPVFLKVWLALKFEGIWKKTW